ncbi:MAG TPA: hypothetical protein VKR83_10690 [Ktedonobacteraceae bacterium]|nr:hypothetical protein [Ktedonobacteraceae bacterium]
MSEQLFSEKDWENLYLILKPRVAFWVRTSRVSIWTRQREEIIEDIVQDALVKVLVYAQKASRGEVRMIGSLENICAVIAYHCYVDARRRDMRLVPLMQDSQKPAENIITWIDTDLSEQAINNIHYELLFIQMACWIVSFPDKQRIALLIDLANRMYFDPFYPTPLQKAFASVGICIQKYKKMLSNDIKERARHAAHLSLAYKRLAQLAYVQRWMLLA